MCAVTACSGVLPSMAVLAGPDKGTCALRQSICGCGRPDQQVCYIGVAESGESAFGLQEEGGLTKTIWQSLGSQHACASSFRTVPVGPLQHHISRPVP